MTDDAKNKDDSGSLEWSEELASWELDVEESAEAKTVINDPLGMVS